jgi:hypothetical protein
MSLLVMLPYSSIGSFDSIGGVYDFIRFNLEWLGVDLCDFSCETYLMK